MRAGIRYLSVCSGIEAATVAWHPLGWEAAAYSEIEAFPRAVLSHHYPDVPLHGDFTTIKGDEYGPVDLLVGGTPCQDFSIAGLRAGLGGERGNLTLEFLRLLGRTRARWVVWENVPGALSSVSHVAPDFRPPEIDLDAGNGPEDGEEIVVEDSYDADESHAFACFLAGLSELGYGWAYRVLDAQFAGVPQRRRRVFVVGYLGDWRRAGAVLFERHSLSGHSTPSRQPGQGIAGTLKACAGKSGTPNGAEEADRLVVTQFGDVAGALTARHDSSPCADRGMNMVAFTAKDHGADASEIAPTLRAGGHANSHANAGVMPAVAFQEAQTGCREYDTAGTLRADGPGHDPVGTRIREGMAVRRLTPRECERLQGFHDDYTLIPYRGKPAADGPRYKALGNSMAVPVMAWIGQRIAMVEAIAAESIAA